MKKSIFVQGKPVYVVGDYEACVYNAILTESLNDAGTLTFTVPPTNPEYSAIAERAKVVLYDETNPYWRGFVISANKNAKNELAVTCVGELAYLNDSIQPQAKYQNKTPRELFTAYVNEHNAQSSEQFAVGLVTVSDPNDNVYRFTNYETTLTALRDDLCASLGGFLRIRYDHHGVRILDLVTIEDYGNSNGQIIEFGENLLDYAEGMSAEEIATQCIPLGVHLEEPVVEGLDAYLDIKSVNAGLDYVQDDDAVAALGEIKRVVHFDNVTDPQTLKNKGIEWLSSAQYAKLTIQVTAVDLSSLGVYVAPKKWRDFTVEEWDDLAGMTWDDLKGFDPMKDKFNIGDLVRCFATPYGMDAVYPIQTLVTYLQDPTKNNITIANEKQQTYTQMQATAEAKIKKEASTVLAEAQANASELIKYANEGNVYIKYNEDGKAVELCIMDTDSPDTATKVWRWSMGGFGYSDTGYDGTYSTAITMNGSIVADFITAGTMLADRIKGGTLELGGLNDEYGIFKMLDNDGTTRIEIRNNMFKFTPREKQATLISWTGEDSVNNEYTGSLYINGHYLDRNRSSSAPYTWDYSAAYIDDRIDLSENTDQYTTRIEADGMTIKYNGTTKISTSTASGNVTAVSFTNTSEEDTKKDIKPLKSVLDKVIKADICTYKIKDDDRKGAKEHIGMVIGEKYNAPEEIINEEENGKGIDLYSMCSMLWKAVQELSEELDQLKGEKKDALDK